MNPSAQPLLQPLTKARRRFGRGQTGQALVILAIGFIALLGFVGIVTDVSLLFVRYSSLRRAVDAAAVAAAGQMRRATDPTPANGNAAGDGEAQSFANLNLAARQFIELYGLSPRDVLVETCRAQQVAFDNFQRPLDRDGTLMYNYQLYNGVYRVRIDDVNGDGSINQDDRRNAAANLEDIRRYEQLCTRDELKLVRVTAQIDSPTVFLSLLGYPSITLTESAISQTAVVDAVLIFDVSESMLSNTGYDDWETLGLGRRYVPQYIDYFELGRGDPLVDPVNHWEIILTNNQTTLNTLYPPASFTPTGVTPQAEPREFCRVRAFPFSVLGSAAFSINRSTYPPLRGEYQTYLNTVQPGGQNFTQWFSFNGFNSSTFSGFEPMYDYFGCCNDPDGDMLFDDLICQPFKQARDAAEGFFDRLDFVRGDRVALVTFDRRAHLIDPDGAGNQSAMLETQTTIGNIANAETFRRGALETLRATVGVRAEPSFYADSDNDGYWDALIDGGRVSTYDTLMNGRVIGNIIDTPAKDACPFQMAMLPPDYSLVDRRHDTGFPDRTNRTTLMDDISTAPSWYRTAMLATNPSFRFAQTSYEFWASCRGTNIGGGLESASQALYLNGRREGAVWIMVLLSDGAAAGTDPLARQQPTTVSPGRTTASLSVPANPYSPPPVGAPGNVGYTPLGGEYGGFGACPYGPQSNPGRLLPVTGLGGLSFPYCTDLAPETRNFCGELANNPDVRPIDVTTNCNIDNIEGTGFRPYDPDDYARDWADWVGLADLPGPAAASSGRVGEQQLPAIFTIGFNLGYVTDCRANRTDPAQPCTTDAALRARNPQDFLGEELLRYIGDVGDNNRLDDDYWQFLMGDRIPNDVSDNPTGQAVSLDVDPDWGIRGPCQTATWTTNRWDFEPIEPMANCGNYWNAIDGTALTSVFNQIAARMFTRLSQ
jgi:hypothetical protein